MHNSGVGCARSATMASASVTSTLTGKDSGSPSDCGDSTSRSRRWATTGIVEVSSAPFGTWVRTWVDDLRAKVAPAGVMTPTPIVREDQHGQNGPIARRRPPLRTRTADATQLSPSRRTVEIARCTSVCLINASVKRDESCDAWPVVGSEDGDPLDQGPGTGWAPPRWAGAAKRLAILMGHVRRARGRSAKRGR